MVDGGFGQAKSTVCIFVVFSLQKLEGWKNGVTHLFKLTRRYIKKKYVQSKGDLLK
jgi:hypothetical protein